MLLSDEQIELLSGDLDYILPRTKCDSVLLHRGHVLNAVARDPDVLLDLVDGLPPADARWLSVPIDSLRSLIVSRSRGVSFSSAPSQPLLIDA